MLDRLVNANVSPELCVLETLPFWVEVSARITARRAWSQHRQLAQCADDLDLAEAPLDAFGDFLTHGLA